MEKAIEESEKLIPDVSALVTITVINLKNPEVERKIPRASGLVTTTVPNTKI